MFNLLKKIFGIKAKEQDKNVQEKVVTYKRSENELNVNGDTEMEQVKLTFVVNSGTGFRFTDESYIEPTGAVYHRKKKRSFIQPTSSIEMLKPSTCGKDKASQMIDYCSGNW